jgi:hypothetical protein
MPSPMGMEIKRRRVTDVTDVTDVRDGTDQEM